VAVWWQFGGPLSVVCHSVVFFSLPFRGVHLACAKCSFGVCLVFFWRSFCVLWHLLSVRSAFVQRLIGIRLAFITPSFARFSVTQDNVLIVGSSYFATHIFFTPQVAK
jgi:hypothetical protein